MNPSESKPQRVILVALGSAALAVTLVGLVFWQSPVGMGQFCAAGLIAGAGWLAGGLIARRKPVLLAIYTLFMLVGVVATVPFLLMLWFYFHPVVGDHFAVANSRQDDDRLGSITRPGSWGHDANGFRNARVPDRVDVVAIGDSQTWGYNVSRDATWPDVLADLTGQTVYNMSSIAYGPVEYWVLADRALEMFAPDVILVAFYFGNDLYDAYESIYQRDTFSTYRDPDQIAASQRAGVDLFDDTIRVQAGIIGLEDADAEFSGSPVTQFTAAYRSLGLDLDEPRIAEGMRITQVLLGEIARHARAADTRLAVVLIPTKERVYARLMSEQAVPPGYARVVELEQRAHAELIAMLDAEHITYIDCLPALAAAVEAGQALYPFNANGHPEEAGYALIAATIRDQWGDKWPDR